MERQSRPYTVSQLHGKVIYPWAVLGPSLIAVCVCENRDQANLIADLLCYRWRCLSGEQMEPYDVKGEFDNKWPDAPTRF